ncbi:MAG: YajQ family cyclic di-GMP-binding protein [Ornithinimicrobium sp.]
MADSSFDIVSKVDRQELANAVNQAAKEVGQRYDFRNVGAEVELSGDEVHMKASTAERCLAVLDVLQTKMVKRGVSLKALDLTHDGEPRASGKEYRLDAGLKDGISSEQAKKVTKLIRDEGPKSAKTQIQGDEVRVTSKSRDDLQAVQHLVREADLDFAVQFTNRR